MKRIKIEGDPSTTPSIGILKKYLMDAGYYVEFPENILPDYIIKLEQVQIMSVGSAMPILYHWGESDFGKTVIQELFRSKLTGLQLDWSNFMDGNEIVLRFSANQAQDIERALLNAVLRITLGKVAVHESKKIVPESLWMKWGRKLLPAVVFLALAETANAQVIPQCMWDSSVSRCISAGDQANRAIRVNVVAGGAGGGTVDQGAGAGAATNYWNTRLTDGTSFIPLPTALAGAGGLKVECLSGCGGAAAFADASAFTFGTTSIGNTGFVVDDTATNTVAENSAATPRMNTNRIIYFDISKTTANTTAILTTGTGGTFPVTGTFWQATQPVSGTVAVSNSFLLDATFTGRINTLGQKAMAASTPVVLASDQSSIPVTGTFFQATQPVSIAATVATDPTDEDARVLGRVKIHDGTDTALVSAAGALSTDVGTVTTLPEVTQDTASALKTEIWGVAKGATAAAGFTSHPIDANTNAIVVIPGAALIAGGATIGSIASITTSVVPGTAATNLGKAEDAAHTTGDTGVYIQGVRTDPTTTGSTSANTEYGSIAIDYVGAVPLAIHPGRFSCFLNAITVTTVCQAAPAAGLRNYVTSVHISNMAATVQGVDIVAGTGAACVTGLAALTHKFQMGTNQLTTSPFIVQANFGRNPLVPAAAAAICVRPTAATSFGVTITGEIAP